MITKKIAELNSVKKRNEVAGVIAGLEDDQMIDILTKLKDPIIGAYCVDTSKLEVEDAVNVIPAMYRKDLVRYSNKQREIVNAIGVQSIEGLISESCDAELVALYCDHCHDSWFSNFVKAIAVEIVNDVYDIINRRQLFINNLSEVQKLNLKKQPQLC